MTSFTKDANGLTAFDRHNLQSARKLIASAEADLGSLSDGQCRDLLMDNIALDSGTIKRLVAIIRPNHPTFLAKFLPHGATALQCRETSTRYIVADHHNPYGQDDCGAYREGQLISTGPRAAMLNAIESDARWSLRNPN